MCISFNDDIGNGFPKASRILINHANSFFAIAHLINIIMLTASYHLLPSKGVISFINNKRRVIDFKIKQRFCRL